MGSHLPDTRRTNKSQIKNGTTHTQKNTPHPEILTGRRSDSRSAGAAPAERPNSDDCTGNRRQCPAHWPAATSMSAPSARRSGFVGPSFRPSPAPRPPGSVGSSAAGTAATAGTRHGSVRTNDDTTSNVSGRFGGGRWVVVCLCGWQYPDGFSNASASRTSVRLHESLINTNTHTALSSSSTLSVLVLAAPIHRRRHYGKRKFRLRLAECTRALSHTNDMQVDCFGCCTYMRNC